MLWLCDILFLLFTCCVTCASQGIFKGFLSSVCLLPAMHLSAFSWTSDAGPDFANKMNSKYWLIKIIVYFQGVFDFKSTSTETSHMVSGSLVVKYTFQLGWACAHWGWEEDGGYGKFPGALQTTHLSILLKGNLPLPAQLQWYRAVLNFLATQVFRTPQHFVYCNK